MNEQIRQLYIRAINDTKHDPADDINIQIAEKFAKLIIQEAGEAFWSEACHVSDLAYEEYYRNSKKIKQHFGVEL